MAELAATLSGSTGCPSGLAPLEPATRAGSGDPSPFVEVRDGVSRLVLLVRGAKCAGCMARIEGAVKALPGVQGARLNLSNGRLEVSWTGSLAAGRVSSAVSALGYGVSPFDLSQADAAASSEERKLLVALGVAAFAAMNIMLLSVSVWAGHGEMGERTRTLFHALSGAIAIPTVLFSGRVFFASAWAALSRGRANMDVPVSLGLILATLISVFETAMGGEHAYFDAAVMLCFFLLIGRFLDARLRRRAHAAAHDLAALQGRSATRIDTDGTARAVRAADIRPGDTLLLAAGERALVDCEIVEGRTELDESLVSGETAPRLAEAGARLFSGAVNLTRPVSVRALAAAQDSLMAEIGRMLEAGEQRRSAYRRIADMAVRIYVPLVHTTAALTLVGWLLVGRELREAVFIAVSTLIITCPCALALAAPVVQVVAAGRLFRRGVFLRSGDALERLARIDHVVLDKTGTLTLGVPEWRETPMARAVLMEAAALARSSRHPLSRALVAAAGPGQAISGVTEVPGRGLEAEIDGERVRLGSAEWVDVEADASGASSLWYARGGADPVPFHFEDRLRDDAVEAVAALKAQGFGVEILSGDRPETVSAAAQALGLDRWQAQVSPAGKVARLEALRGEGRRVLMVGDGLNDAGALALAHAALAPGGAMDVSQSAADAVYSGGGLSAVPAIIAVATQARRRMLENFALAAVYNLIAVPVAVAGFATPLVAAIAMSASSVLVTLNALRLKA